ncbi:50S ribosomal protein L39e [uncultured archaeon]|nr:50S ribosomal protein L39e [uncultured archaeon]
MMSKKTFLKKKRLGKATRQNRRLPVFVAVRTKRKVTQNSKRRTWRTQKLQARKW